MQPKATFLRFFALLLMSLGLVAAPTAFAQSVDLTDADRSELKNILETNLTGAIRELDTATKLMGTDPVKSCATARSANALLTEGRDRYYRFHARMMAEKKNTAELDKLKTDFADMISDSERTATAYCDPKIQQGTSDPAAQAMIQQLTQKASRYTTLMAEGLEALTGEKPVLACQKFTEALTALNDLEAYMISLRAQAIKEKAHQSAIDDFDQGIRDVGTAKIDTAKLVRDCQTK